MSAPRVRWLVAGTFLPSSPGRRFALAALAGTLGEAARGLHVTVEDRIGAGDATPYPLSLDGPHAFGLSEVVASSPDLRLLRVLREALAGERTLGPEERVRLESTLGRGRLAAALTEARRAANARGAVLGVLDEALYATARDVLRHPNVARLESAWRGLEWLGAHCPPSAGMDVEVLDAEPHRLVEALGEGLGAAPLQRPDACFVLDEVEDADTLLRLAALGEDAGLPVVVPLAASLLEEGGGWERVRAGEASRWLCAAVNPVVVKAEQQGPVRRECFASPALAVAVLLAASLRDTGTFARLVGAGSSVRAPAVWRPREGSGPVATEACLSLREQERLGARGVLGVSGWWDSDAVHLLKAPTVYGGRDATTLPAQLLTGRLVRLAQELAERLPAQASPEAVAAVCTRAAEAFLPTGTGRGCELHGRVVSTGGGTRGLHLRAALRPELAGTHVQLEFTVPLRG